MLPIYVLDLFCSLVRHNEVHEGKTIFYQLSEIHESKYRMKIKPELFIRKSISV
jgi:hypothetical protein